MIYQYAYLIGCLILSILWLLLFLLRKDLKKDILFGSLIGAPFGITNYLFVPDYWHPPFLFDLQNIIGFGIEDVLFAFFVGGITAVTYEVFARKKIRKIRKQKYNKFTPIFILTIVLLGLEIIFPQHTIYNLFISFLSAAIIMGAFRKDLIKQMLISGVLFSFIYFSFFALFNLLFNEFIERYYNIDNIWGITILTVPIEEIIFGFSVGAVWSVLYEYIKGYRIK